MNTSAWYLLRRCTLVAPVFLSVAWAPLVAQPRRPTSAAQSSPSALLNRAAALYTSGTLAAEFTQTVRNPLTLSDATSAGTYFQRGAGVFSVNFTQPAGDRIVSDGRTLWVYVPSATPGQVLKLSVGSMAPGGVDIVGQFFSAPSRRWNVVDGGAATIGSLAARRLNLTPKSDDSGIRSAAIWLDPSSATMRQLEITETSGLVRTLRFQRITRGGSMPASTFGFTVPRGVTVVDQGAFAR
jgi:outer membrane lipoprotein carrier protein